MPRFYVQKHLAVQKLQDALHCIFYSTWRYLLIVIIDNFYIALFPGVHKLTVLYNIQQHFLSEKNIVYGVAPVQKGI